MAVRYTLSRRTALDLLRRADVSKPPVPVEKLAALVNATIRYEPFDGEMSGMVHRSSEGKSIIGVNSSHSQVRRRFTIAHELGHLLLHAHEDFHVDEKFLIEKFPMYRKGSSSLATDDSEIEANQFAAELLMPSHMLKVELERLHGGVDVDDIGNLASVFDVSIQAMTIRLSSTQR